MVLISSGYNLVACMSSFYLPRVSSLILWSAIAFWWLYTTLQKLIFCPQILMDSLEGDLRIFRCPICRRILCIHGCRSGIRKPPWHVGYPLLRFFSAGGFSSNLSSGTQKQLLPITLHGLGVHLLVLWAQVEQISSSQWSSCLLVWSRKVSWLIRLSACLWSSVVSCELFQIVRPHRGLTYLPYWASWILFLSWRVWGGILMSSGLAYGEKSGSPSHSVQEGLLLTTSWPFPTLWFWILSHTLLPLSGWWGVWMGFHLELLDILLLPVTGLAPGCEFYMCLPRGVPWCVPLELQI